MSEFIIENRIFHDVETLSREELRLLQRDRLRETVGRAARVPFYKELFAREKVTPDTIRSVDDIRRLPLTSKEDLRENYPLGFLAVPREKLKRIHGSSGTTGKPTFVAYTARDVDTWADLCARFLVAGGLRPEHLVQIAFGYGLFTGGFGLHYGVERVGSAVLPAASGNTQRQIVLMRDLATDVLICTPSYALTIADAARAMAIDPAKLPLRFAHFGAEPWTEEMRAEIEASLGLVAFNNYGLSEVVGPGVSGECAARRGMHCQEDHFLIECLNSETLQPVAPGECGELVITTLTKEAMPMVRYRTRDIAPLDPEPCPCGRTTVRMGWVAGRSDDMLIVRGVNVFPSQIEEAVLRVEGTAPHYEIIVDRPGRLDALTVRVEVRPEEFSEDADRMQALRDRIDRQIQVVAGVRAQVELVPPHTIERFAGKAKRVLDRRKL